MTEPTAAEVCDALRSLVDKEGRVEFTLRGDETFVMAYRYVAVPLAAIARRLKPVYHNPDCPRDPCDCESREPDELPGSVR